MPKQIVYPPDFIVARDGREIGLTIAMRTVSFVEETIPDGSMAGMKGHRPIEGSREFVFEMPLDQAQQLYRDLGNALQAADGLGEFDQ